MDIMPYEYKTTNIDSSYLTGLLVYLLRGRSIQRASSGKPQNSACGPEDIYVYEYDIQNQVFNSSFQDPNSAVIQRLQSDIADWTVEEIYKRNLVSYITDDAHLTKIRRVLESVFDKLQKEHFATSNKKIDWENMVLIPTQKINNDK